MKGTNKAFTLIELLVVIAIIAILAAILFPVFAQAKNKAKQTSAISANTQFSKAMLMYASDYDDLYPRDDSCIPYTSLNPELNRPGRISGDGCSQYPFAYRTNHYSWQKWIRPYVQNLQIFFHPALKNDETAWREQGEILGGYGLNLALTGALNTWGNPNRLGAYRNSFLGGSPTNVPDPSSAMLFLDVPSSSINYAPVFTTPSATYQTAYPTAIRELWAPMFMKWVSDNDCTPTQEVDSRFAVFNKGFIIGRVDGSAKWYNARQFLAETPDRNQYRVGTYGGGWQCGPNSGSRTINNPPQWDQEWPLWALR